MLTKDQLQVALLDIESDRIERTSSITKFEKFCEAICAFANDLSNSRKPGYLMLGVDDSGKTSGLIATDELLKNLAAIRSDGQVLPQPAMTIEKFALSGGDVVVVEVLPSDLPPVRYKSRVHVRVGPRRAIATEQEERMLSERRVSQARSFDALPCRESSIDDLALAQFGVYRQLVIDAETIESNHRSIAQQLASLRLFDPSKNCLTNAGVLLFAKNVRYFLPGAYVQYLKLPGNDLTELPIDQAEISGDLYAIIRELEVRIKALIQTSMSVVSGFQEKLHPDYPEWALRELVLNAVMHRNYDSNTPISFYVFQDHIAIQNPGGLHGEANPENFPMRNSYRNPVIAEAMKSFGFINRFGFGIQRAQKLLLENGNPPAAFYFDAHSVLVKIFKRK